ncbi:MAG: 2-oxo acid dehydrogenase subunit E2, partial [Deltaproteobacteria bacterium]|nr:2-oxo acid dehydrogenase subunit E2 [Deltaproteobacteria bacterium]
MPNLNLVQKTDLSSFRRIAIGTWKTAYDPSVYGSMTLHMDEAMRYMAEFREKTGRRLTLTHMMAKAVAGVLVAAPDANAIMRWNRIYLRKDIGVFFQVAMEDKDTGQLDLSGATIHDAEKKSLVEIVDEFKTQVEKVRTQKDEQLEGTRSMFKKIPYLLLNLVLNTIGFLTYTLNLDLRRFGIPQDPFGSVMVTNVGSLGLEAAYVPLVPYSRVPLLIATGAVNEEPVVEDGEIRIGKVMRLFATFDHRILDGTHAATMSKVLKEWFHDPYGHFDDLSAYAEAEEIPAADAPTEEP